MFKMTENSKQLQFGFEVLDFPGLGFILPLFVSVRGASFVLRISDFSTL